MTKRRPISEPRTKILADRLSFSNGGREASSALPPRRRSFQYDIALAGFDCSRKARTAESVIGGADSIRPVCLVARVGPRRAPARLFTLGPVLRYVRLGHRGARTRTDTWNGGQEAAPLLHRDDTVPPPRPPALSPPALPGGDALADRSPVNVRRSTMEFTPLPKSALSACQCHARLIVS